MNNQLKSIALLGALSVLLVGLGNMIAPGQLAVFAGLAMAMNVAAYFFSDRIVLRMHGAREVTAEEAPELHKAVAELSVLAELPMPKVCVVPDRHPNAFATGRNPANGVVAVTEGLLDLLDRRELRGVIAHELAHIKNRDVLISTLAAVAATAISSTAQALSLGALFGSKDREASGSGLLAILAAPICATLIQLGISRSREHLADELGARISGDPGSLARALLKLDRASSVEPSQRPAATASLFIVNPFGAGGGLRGWFSTHPSTEERVSRLLALKSRGVPYAARRRLTTLRDV